LRIPNNDDKSVSGKINFSEALAAKFSNINEAHNGDIDIQDNGEDPNGLMPSFQKLLTN
jgi:hypothetical protein